MLTLALHPSFLPLLPHAHPESLKMAGETEVETPAAPQPDVAEEKKEIAEAENKTEEKKDEEKKEEEKPAEGKAAKKPKEKKPKKVPAPPPPPVHKKDFATDVVYVYQGSRPTAESDSGRFSPGGRAGANFPKVSIWPFANRLTRKTSGTALALAVLEDPDRPQHLALLPQGGDLAQAERRQVRGRNMDQGVAAHRKTAVNVIVAPLCFYRRRNGCAPYTSFFYKGQILRTTSQ